MILDKKLGSSLQLQQKESKQILIFFKVNKCSLYRFRPVIHITKPKVASKALEPRGQAGAPISLTLTPAEQPARPQGKKKGSRPKAEDSDTDPEAPVAQQMLSFVMDDPDFESEASDTPKIAKVK